MKDTIFSQLDFGPITEFLNDDNITDISYSNGGNVWLKTLDKGIYMVNRPEINNALMEKLAFQCSNVMGTTFNMAHPFLDAESTELRLNFVHESIATNGIACVIRKTPAKINLTLDVTGKLENGYHTLSMIMQSIDVCDELSFEKTADETILFSMNKELPDKIPAEKNLVYKAAKLMKDTFKIDGGFKIHLTKNIPAAAGLAGGSSDCAATLIGINELCGLGLDIEKLCEIGVKLGADVPFCIRKGTMLAEGIGEILTPLTSLTGIPVLLIKPNISISTPYVYKHLKLNELDYHPDNKAVISYIKDKNIKKIIFYVFSTFFCAIFFAKKAKTPK